MHPRAKLWLIRNVPSEHWKVVARETHGGKHESPRESLDITRSCMQTMMRSRVPPALKICLMRRHSKAVVDVECCSMGTTVLCL